MTRRHKPGDPKLVVAYIRSSTTDQRLSPDAQRHAIEAYASLQGMRIASIHCDTGISGTTPLEGRPALLGALDAIRAHGAGVLLVLRRDRLARSLLVAASVDLEAKRAGARVVTIDGGGNGDAPADEFARNVLDAASQLERALIAQRTKAALQAKRARGERAGEVPFGYQADDAGKLSPHPAEQRLIATVDALRAAAHTVRGIAAELVTQGFVGRTGKPLSHTQVHRIISRNEQISKPHPPTDSMHRQI